MIGVDRRHHRRMHTNAYYNAVNKVLEQFDPRKNPNAGCTPGSRDIREALKDIGKQIKMAKWAG